MRPSISVLRDSFSLLISSRSWDSIERRQTGHLLSEVPILDKLSVSNLKYSIEESEIGYKNFCVVEIFIESIDWLYLAARGHRRAYFALKNSSVEKKWLIP